MRISDWSSDVCSSDLFEWSSDPRLTLPTMVRMTEAQVRNLVAGIECPTRVIYADPPQPYLPEPLRSEHVRLLPDGELVVLPGGHPLHTDDPAEVAAALGDFSRAEGSEERRVGKECGPQCRSGWSPKH